MFDNYIIYDGYFYKFETGTIAVFQEILSNLSDPVTLKDFDEKYKE